MLCLIPGQGEIFRKRKALALLALASVVGLLSAGAASARQADVSIAGAGSSLVNPLVQQYVPAISSAFGYTLTYASVGSGTASTLFGSR